MRKYNHFDFKVQIIFYLISSFIETQIMVFMESAIWDQHKWKFQKIEKKW